MAGIQRPHSLPWLGDYDEQSKGADLMALGNFSGEKIGTKVEERRQKSSYPNWGTK